MSDKVGLREVAAEAQVSPTTVSRVLNNRGYLSEETKNKVYAAMEKLQYYPNELARALSKKRSFTVGIIFPTLTNPFHAEVIQHIESYLSQKGYKVLLCNSLNNPEKEKQYLTMLRKNQVDGIIAATHNRNIEEYNIPGLPIVAVDRDLGKNVTIVSCDNYSGAKMACEKLIKDGCRQILCIRGDSKIKLPANARTTAYKDVMQAHDLPEYILEDPLVKPSAERYQIISDYLQTHPSFDGVFAGDDVLASFAIQILGKIGKNVPADVKVVGFDGAALTLALKPELTTVCQPIKQIAQVTVSKLLNRIDGHVEENITNLPVTMHFGTTA